MLLLFLSHAQLQVRQKKPSPIHTYLCWSTSASASTMPHWLPCQPHSWGLIPTFATSIYLPCSSGVRPLSYHLKPASHFLPLQAQLSLPSTPALMSLIPHHFLTYTFILLWPFLSQKTAAIAKWCSLWLIWKILWLASDFTASFTFPRRLASHLAFLEDLPIYQCSCTPATHAGKVVHHIGRIKIFLDSVTRLAVVRLSFSALSFKIIRNPFSLTSLNGFATSRMCRSLIVAESISVDVNLLSVEMLRDRSPKLQRVNCLASLRS